ncbi:MAG: hypothetical protein JXR96_25115 [Deltaproteobacteria bacterium]|nr:hypothetical protein [Deltaproteobacteria bacterium]
MAARIQRLDELEPRLMQRDELSAAERLRFACDALQHNQSLVSFTDAKANSLLLVNSIFLATAAGTGRGGFSLAAALAAAATVLLCLAVLYARLPGPAPRERGKLMFFGDILARKSAAVYAEDLSRVGASELAEATARQVYSLASVLDRKFRAYGLAQLATMVSAALWLTSLLQGFSA